MCPSAPTSQGKLAFLPDTWAPTKASLESLCPSQEVGQLAPGTLRVAVGQVVCLDSAWLSLPSSDLPRLMGLGISSCTSGQRSPWAPRPPLAPPVVACSFLPRSSSYSVAHRSVATFCFLLVRTDPLGQLGSKRALLLLLLSPVPRGQPESFLPKEDLGTA